MAIVFGDFWRAWREFLVGATFGQSASNQSSMTWLKVSCFVRRGSGDCSCARSANSSSRSAWASAFSTRSTFRREPSGKQIGGRPDAADACRHLPASVAECYAKVQVSRGSAVRWRADLCCVDRHCRYSW